MPKRLGRLNPVILLSLVTVIVLSLGLTAGAQLAPAPAPAPVGGGGALGVAMGQVGKPFAWGAEGPHAFSCTGLLRYSLRGAGINPAAPWVPEEYLGLYPAVPLDQLQPGDIVIYPGWGTMYAGNGNIVAANEGLGMVAVTPMGPGALGAVRPM
jgi:cell wall-associated NlpC family hydrolase